MRVENGRDLIIVDSSAIEYLVLDVCGLHQYDVHTIGPRSAQAACAAG
jgi:hypothetical protein